MADMMGLKKDVMECIQRHRRKKTKKLKAVERDMQAIIKKRGTTIEVLVNILVSIPVHIGRWVIFRNKAVLVKCLKAGAETNGYFRPTPLGWVKSCPVLKTALVEVQKSSKNNKRKNNLCHCHSYST